MTKTSAETNVTAFILVIVGVFSLVIVASFASDFPPHTYLGRAGDLLLTRTAIIIYCVVLSSMLILILHQLWVARKIKQSARQKYQESTEMIIRPVRLYEIESDAQSPLTNYAEIQNSLRSISRKGDEGVPELVDQVLISAIRGRASDIHVETGVENAMVKFRMDGILHEVGEIPKILISRFITRLRVLSNLTIYQKGKPQDGRIELKISQHHYDVRLSIMPTLHGEKAVIRLFESGEHQFDLARLGMSGPMLEHYCDLLLRSKGTILLTGPTGSGKTTTIYSSIRYILLNQGDRTNIVTIEDPIEYEIRGINQTQVNPKRELTFASGLRSLLRQDPDVIIVGEIRDYETAEICSQAGFTGHLVISTIHADSSAGVFNRLIDLGIEPFLVASSLSGILAQRLVRRNCPDCIEPVIPSLKSLKILGIPADSQFKFLRGKGCPKCNGKGYIGRIGIFELLLVTQPLREAMQRKISTAELMELAAKEGLMTLRMDAIDKIQKGIVDADEVARVIS